MFERYGSATLQRDDAGVITVIEAAECILVSTELLSKLDGTDHYVDGVLTLDTAGEYRYCKVEDVELLAAVGFERSY